MASVGAAIRDAGGYPVGSVSVAFPMLEQFMGLLDELPERLVALSEEAAARMGFAWTIAAKKRDPSPPPRSAQPRAPVHHVLIPHRR